MRKIWFRQLQEDLNTIKRSIGLADLPAQSALYLCIGSVHYLNGLKLSHNGDALLVVQILKPKLNAPINTLQVNLNSEDICEYWVVNEPACSITGKIKLCDLFSDMQLNPQLLTVLQEQSVPDAAVFSTYAPLFCMQTDISEAANIRLEKNIYFYSQIRFSPEDALFLRTNREPFVSIQGMLGDLKNIEAILSSSSLSSKSLAWFDQAISLHSEHPSYFNNHQYYYKKCFSEEELELKINLFSDVDIWQTTLEVYKRIKHGAFPNYIMEYKDEFQQWDNLNHVYDVRDPVEDKGYISFIPTNDGKYVVKRKWFAEDQFKRRESLWKGVSISQDFAQYIDQNFNITATYLGTFRRIRYDLNVESSRTGHVYGVFFDHCTVLEHPTALLNQCEIEYLRSRVYLEPEPESIELEMAEMADWLKSVFCDMGIEYEQNHYSKLSFLRDVTQKSGIA